MNLIDVKAKQKIESLTNEEKSTLKATKDAEQHTSVNIEEVQFNT
jgi:hypothetical protein